MSVEQQYIDLFSQTEAMICRHSAEVLNAPRAAAFADFERLGFPTRKVEKYKYTDVSKFFEPDYGLNLNRLDIPVNPYEVFKWVRTPSLTWTSITRQPLWSMKQLPVRLAKTRYSIATSVEFLRKMLSD